MRCHLALPALLPPPELAEEFLHGLQLPALSRLLSKAQPAVDSQIYLAWCCSRFGVGRQSDWPLAPVTLLADGGEPDGAIWLRSDPVHLQVNRDRLVLRTSSGLAVDADEADALVAALNSHFAADRYAFSALHPQRWYLRVPKPVNQEPIDLVCTPLADAAGQDIDALLPTGADAARFRALCNEAQMLLFDHPVNLRREEAGAPAINSIWLWGGGTLPAVHAPANTTMWARENILRSLALASGAVVAEPPSNGLDWLQQATRTGEQLIVIDDLVESHADGDAANWQRALTALERDWFAPLVSGLAGGRIDFLRLTAFGGQHNITAQVSRGDLFKFWRGGRPLAELLAV